MLIRQVDVGLNSMDGCWIRINRVLLKRKVCVIYNSQVHGGVKVIV